MTDSPVAILTAIREAVGNQAEALDEFRKANSDRLDALQERTEQLEARASRPSKSDARAGEPAAKHKVFHTSSGLLYELPHDVKAADAIPMTGEAPPVDFERWLGAVVAGPRCGDAKALEFAASRKQVVTSGGISVPAEYVPGWIDRIRAESVLQRAGISTLVMTGATQSATAILTDPLSSWHAEAASVSTDNPSFTTKTLTARTLVARCTASLEVSQDVPDFASQLTALIAKSLAAELDRTGLTGSGVAPEPQGLVGAPGVVSSAAIGSLANYAPILDAVKGLLAQGVPLDVATRTVVMSPYSWYALEALKTGLSSDELQLRRPAALQNTNFLIDAHDPNGLDTDGSPQTSSIILGDWADLVLGVRAEASIEVLKLSSYCSNLLLEFIGVLRADFLVRRPKSFIVLSGVSVGS